MVKVARLQSEFCTKDFFRATNFLTKNAPKFPPKFLSLYSEGQKKSHKIPAKLPTKFPKFPCKKSKKNTITIQNLGRATQVSSYLTLWKWLWVFVLDCLSLALWLVAYHSLSLTLCLWLFVFDSRLWLSFFYSFFFSSVFLALEPRENIETPVGVLGP